MKQLAQFLKLPLYWQIFIAIILAIASGYTLQHLVPANIAASATTNLDFIGMLFIRALKMLIVPLIASAIISSMAAIGKEKGFGRLASKTLIYYAATSLLAILVGLAVVNVIKPGIIDGQPGMQAIDLPAPDASIEDKLQTSGPEKMMSVFKNMIPPNIVEAAAQGNFLGLISFSLLFGFFITRLPEELSHRLEETCKAIYEVMLRITEFVMRFSPLGVFALIASICAQTQIEDVIRLKWFPVAVLLALGIHMFVTMPTLLSLIGRVNPLAHYRAMVSALLTAFSTASSSATLPMTMDCLTEKAGVSKRVTSFTTPLGATVNMDGTALYECVAVVFLMQIFGMEIPFATQFTVVALALLTSIGVAGIPSASLVAILIILNSVGMPEASIAIGIALLQFTDRILDMCRTAVNVFGDSCGAVLIARSEGEETSLK
ncbi:MAG: dicarboxylate/amino acid:cation symporter [Verrucomicrobiota bacterium]